MKTQCCKSKNYQYIGRQLFCLDCMKQTKVKTVNLRYLLPFLICIPSFCFNSEIHSDSCPKPIKKVDTEILSEEFVLGKLNEFGSVFPEIGLRQAKLETGNFTSPIALDNKNLFGLKCSCKYSQGTKKGHSYYHSYSDNIKCYVEFTNRYWAKYCKNYAEDPEYIAKLKKMK